MPEPVRHVALATTLKVYVHSASDLPRGDAKGLSDPYVVCFLPPGADPVFQTQVCRQTLDPVWDEEHQFRYNPGASLQFQVLDKDDSLKDLSERLLDFRGIGSDFLGQVTLESEEFYPKGFEGDVMLEGVPGGKNAILHLRITVDEGQVRLPIPSQPAAQPHETLMDTAEAQQLLYSTEEMPAKETRQPTTQAPQHLPQHPPSERLQQNARQEQRGGSCSSTAAPGGLHEVWQLRVTLAAAVALPTTRDSGRCSPYCLCDLAGDTPFQCRTAVITDSREPVWNKTVDMEFSGKEPLVFSIYSKEVWPGKDTLLATATLSANQLLPDGFDGDLGLELCSGAELHTHSERPSLRVQVTCHKVQRTAVSAARREKHQHQKHLEAPERQEHRQDKASSPRPKAKPTLSPKRLKVIIQSFRGLHGLDLSSRRVFSCICAIAGRRYADLQTGPAMEQGYQTVWNLEGELQDYVEGEDLEFHVACEETQLEGSAILRCHQFYPFGFNSDITMANDGQGIVGLLRVKVSVERGASQKHVFPTGLRTLGIQQPSSAADARLKQAGDVWLRSLRPWDAFHASLAAAQGQERHRLSEQSSAILKPKVSRMPISSQSQAQAVGGRSGRSASPSSPTKRQGGHLQASAPLPLSPQRTQHVLQVCQVGPGHSGHGQASNSPLVLSPVPTQRQPVAVAAPQIGIPFVPVTVGISPAASPALAPPIGYAGPSLTSTATSMAGIMPTPAFVAGGRPVQPGVISLLKEAQASLESLRAGAGAMHAVR
ncbi:Synaptotagmin-4 [Symbiodinium microadriaticum]|uniref:Synaptotagmin-4 n=1 Tax=Symbiodinium microadriaticum TaxID=2951 RepID=A0A1Q9CE37_SYMMI|nr:Synaptotagmin-4 [Symbiodinium microadriaticum]CAE7515301.1 SYT4 [Symbiodinium microadriaticum]CAE7949489.1 SYT4 [Symbiodinium sp. KB8]